jgi:Ca-activated chloride channel family protein
MDPILLSALAVGRQSVSDTRGTLTLIVWLVAAIGVAGPTWQLEPSPFAKDSAPLIVLVKADKSMDALLASPSYMERARMKIADLAEERKGQPLGLIAYAGTAHLVLPPTRDTQAVAQMASEIGPDIMPVTGDRLDSALDEASRVLSKGDEVGSIVVLTDSIASDLRLLENWRKANSTYVQILSIRSVNSELDESVRKAGQVLKAPIERMDVEGHDISAIVRRASSVPRFQSGQHGDRWQEVGWWLVPLIALVVLALFRRETIGEHT